jgi:hypothetical protein
VLRWLVLGLAVGAAFAAKSAPALADSDASSDASLTASGSSSVNSSVTDERVAQLAAIATKASSNEKAKLSAIAALGRLGDRRAVRPLVTALTDSSATVRALAAISLGKLGQKSALSSLRQAASDANETVRARVADAIVAISKANGLISQPTTASTSTGAGFGRESRVTEQNPDLYVVMKSCNDDSPGRAEKKDRLIHAEVLRAAMTTELRAAPLVTSASTEAKRLSLRPRMVDVSVTKMILRTKGKMLEVETELRLAISDDSGKMLSFISGGAKVQVPKKGFNWSYLPNLRKEALENAVRGLFGKLVAHLRSTVAA